MQDKNTPQTSGALRFLYGTVLGRALLKLLTKPAVSVLVGKFLDTGLSRVLIPSFIRANRIELSDFIAEDYRSFNEFFVRRIRPELRPVDRAPFSLVSPCDGKLSTYCIEGNSAFTIKGTPYTVEELLQNDALAAQFQGGLCLIFRLSPEDYHRYIYFDDGEKGENHFIPGVLHTVNPVVYDHQPVYKTNSREYSLLRTRHFGEAVQMEVGALMVGRIVNLHQSHSFFRGEEKGRFEFGGSTIVLLLEKNAAVLDPAFAGEQETSVRCGQRIGYAVSREPKVCSEK